MSNADTPPAPDLLLGLIGDNIAQSRAPLLHRCAGAQHGIAVRYDRLVPKDMGQDFDAVFDSCAGRGYRGINITYPYKERAARKAHLEEPLVQAIGAINTVLFEPDGPRGFNTDYSGFVGAYRAVMGDTRPGIACLIGAGGVGRALAFGLVALGAKEIRLVDTDPEKAEALASALAPVAVDIAVTVHATAAEAARGATGLLNATPVGMVGYPGTPLPRDAMVGGHWAFDAIYTPVDTKFLIDARASGLIAISGYELFIYQGIDAWSHFAGSTLDEAALRRALSEQV